MSPDPTYGGYKESVMIECITKAFVHLAHLPGLSGTVGANSRYDYDDPPKRGATFQWSATS